MPWLCHRVVAHADGRQHTSAQVCRGLNGEDVIYPVSFLTSFAAVIDRLHLEPAHVTRELFQVELAHELQHLWQMPACGRIRMFVKDVSACPELDSVQLKGKEEVLQCPRIERFPLFFAHVVLVQLHFVRNMSSD